jgi:hypothetical protein
MRAVWLCLALAGCTAPAALVAQESEVLPPGYPPQIGTVTATLDGAAAAWASYDFSVGAFDASAYFGGTTAAPEFRLLAYVPGQPDLQEGRLHLTGMGPPEAGVLRGALVEIVDEDLEGARLSSAGQSADIVLDRVMRRDTGYGHASGHFRATLCQVGSPVAKVRKGACHVISGTFETDFQYDMH